MLFPYQPATSCTFSGTTFQVMLLPCPKQAFSVWGGSKNLVGERKWNNDARAEGFTGDYPALGYFEKLVRLTKNILLSLITQRLDRNLLFFVVIQ